MFGDTLVMFYVTKHFKINRNYDNKTNFFFVNVKEANQYGFGFQINYKGTLYGFSIHS